MYSSKSWKIISSNLFRWMFVWISIKMLEYDRIDISEGIGVDKTNPSKECKICHYWYFKDINFKYELLLCNGYHGLM